MDNTNAMIGRTIEKLIKERGKTLTEEAEAIGIAQSSLSDIVKGKRELRSESIRRVCEYYGISADYLLGLSKVKRVNPEVHAICEYTGLSEEVVEKLHNMSFNPDSFDYPGDEIMVSDKGVSFDESLYQRINSPSYDRYHDVINDFLVSTEFDTLVDTFYSQINNGEELKRLADGQGSYKESLRRVRIIQEKRDAGMAVVMRCSANYLRKVAGLNKEQIDRVASIIRKKNQTEVDEFFREADEVLLEVADELYEEYLQNLDSEEKDMKEEGKDDGKEK